MRLWGDSSGNFTPLATPFIYCSNFRLIARGSKRVPPIPTNHHPPSLASIPGRNRNSSCRIYLHPNFFWLIKKQILSKKFSFHFFKNFPTPSNDLAAGGDFELRPSGYEADGWSNPDVGKVCFHKGLEIPWGFLSLWSHFIFGRSVTIM